MFGDMAERAPRAGEHLTPNQLDKQSQIVRAAIDVLTSQGLEGCTARGVAANGPLTKSAIHYYFADMDDLVDRAMAGHVAGFEATLKEAGDDPDPVLAFWDTVDCHLDSFRERPSVAHLWFEYWISAARKGRQDAIAGVMDRVRGVFAERLRAAGAADPEEAARAVLVHLLGAVVELSVDAGAQSRILDDAARLTGVARPRLRSDVAG
jgi:DNA-binding transcriptional regulator YbjK